MTSPERPSSVPAGAGGVDREADWFEQEMRDVAYAHEVLHDHDDDTGQPIMVCVECDEASPDVPDWQCRRLRFLAEVRSTRAALAAAEQRADTAEAESAERDHRAYEHGKEIGRASMMGRVEREKRRADTLAAAIEADVRRRLDAAGIPREFGVFAGDAWFDGRAHVLNALRDSVAALSSRPVQPEGKQR